MIYKLHQKLDTTLSWDSFVNKGKTYFVDKEDQSFYILGPNGISKVADFPKIKRILHQINDNQFVILALDQHNNEVIYFYDINEITIPLPEYLLNYIESPKSVFIDNYIFFVEKLSDIKYRISRYNIVSGIYKIVETLQDYIQVKQLKASSNVLAAILSDSNNKDYLGYYDLSLFSSSSSELTLNLLIDDPTNIKSVPKILGINNHYVTALTEENNGNISSKKIEIESKEETITPISLYVPNGSVVTPYDIKSYDIKTDSIIYTYKDISNKTSATVIKKGDSKFTMLDNVDSLSIKAYFSNYNDMAHFIVSDFVNKEIIYYVFKEDLGIQEIGKTKGIKTTESNFVNIINQSYIDCAYFDGVILNLKNNNEYDKENSKLVNCNKILLFTYANETAVKQSFPTAITEQTKLIDFGTNLYSRIHIGDVTDLLNDSFLYDDNSIIFKYKDNMNIYFVTKQSNPLEKNKYRLFKYNSTGVLELNFIETNGQLEHIGKDFLLFKKSNGNFIITCFNPFKIVEFEPRNLVNQSTADFISNTFPGNQKTESYSFDKSVILNNRYFIFFTDYKIFPLEDMASTDSNIIFNGKIPHIYDLENSSQGINSDTIILPESNGYGVRCEQVRIKGNEILFGFISYNNTLDIYKFSLNSFLGTKMFFGIPAFELIMMEIVQEKIMYGIRTVEPGSHKYYLGSLKVIEENNINCLMVKKVNSKVYMVFGPNAEGNYIINYIDQENSNTNVSYITVNETINQIIIDPTTENFYYKGSKNELKRIDASLNISAITSELELSTLISDIVTYQSYNIQYEEDCIKIKIYANSLKFPIELKYNSIDNTIKPLAQKENIYSDGFDIYVYYSSSSPIEDILKKFKPIPQDSGGNISSARKEVYGVEAMMSANAGDIIYLGTLHYDNVPLPLPNKPYLNGNVIDFSMKNDISKYDISNTKTGKEIRWIKVNNNILIADRNILMNASYSILESQKWITGRSVQIDGKEFKIRALTGGVSPKESPLKYYSGAFPLDNEWDLYINNRANYSYLPSPIANDTRNTVTNPNYQSEHNSFWNWSKMFSICYEHVQTEKALNNPIGIRGFNSSTFWKEEESISLNEHIGYRPVLIIDPLADNNNSSNLSILISNYIQTESKVCWDIDTIKTNLTNVKSQVFIFGENNLAVYQGKIKEGKGSQQEDINFLELDQGLYQLKIKTWSNQSPEEWSKGYKISIANSLKAKIIVDIPNKDDYELIWRTLNNNLMNATIDLYINDIKIANDIQEKSSYSISLKDLIVGLNEVKLQLTKNNTIVSTKIITILKQNDELYVLDYSLKTEMETLTFTPSKIRFNAEVITGKIIKVFVSLNGGLSYTEIPYGIMTDISSIAAGTKLTFLLATADNTTINTIDYSYV
jgi:hypothetical protein